MASYGWYFSFFPFYHFLLCFILGISTFILDNHLTIYSESRHLVIVCEQNNYFLDSCLRCINLVSMHCCNLLPVYLECVMALCSCLELFSCMCAWLESMFDIQVHVCQKLLCLNLMKMIPRSWLNSKKFIRYWSLLSNNVVTLFFFLSESFFFVFSHYWDGLKVRERILS